MYCKIFSSVLGQERPPCLLWQPQMSPYTAKCWGREGRGEQNCSWLRTIYVNGLCKNNKQNYDLKASSPLTRHTAFPTLIIIL